jgi:hypothetical protein
MNQARQISKKNSSVIYLDNHLAAKNSRFYKNCDGISRSLLFSFIEGTSINAATGNDFVLDSSHVHLDLQQLSPGLLAAIWLLCAEEATQEELSNLAHRLDRTNASLFRLHCYIQQFIELGLLCHTVRTNNDSLATLIPLATPYQFHFSQAVLDKKYSLSHLTCCHRDNQLLTLESSLFPGKVIIKDWRSEAMINELAKPQDIHDLSKLTDVSIDDVQLFLSLLLSAKILSESGQE